jgi:prepilin-type N-terminal cleavage/methylation domain-containing protein
MNRFRNSSKLRDAPAVLKRRFGHRDGLSLLEVILSIAILGTSMAIISQFFYLGYRAADRARRQFDATLICDSVMAELAAGVVAPQPISGAEPLNAPNWTYSVDVVDSDIQGLLLATVSVRQRNSQAVEMSLVRLLPDPEFDPLEDQ